MQYTHEEVQARYEAWARLPATNDGEIRARGHAWVRYVEARDNLTPGSVVSNPIFGDTLALRRLGEGSAVAQDQMALPGLIR